MADTASTVECNAYELAEDPTWRDHWSVKWDEAPLLIGPSESCVEKMIHITGYGCAFKFVFDSTSSSIGKCFISVFPGAGDLVEASTSGEWGEYLAAYNLCIP